VHSGQRQDFKTSYSHFHIKNIEFIDLKR